MKTLHTIYTNFAKRVFFLLFTLIIGGGSALGATWTWTASNVNELGSNTSNAITLNGKEWTTTRSSGTNQNQLQSNCIQIGAKDAAQTITLKSSAFTGKILSVAVECASYQSYHSVAISVGGTSYLSATPTPKWTTVGSKEGTGESSGEIQISFTKNNSSARALYLKSITIEYDESSVEDDEPVSSCGWVATDINNLSSTDLVVITMTNSTGTTYAMSNNNGTSSAPAAVEVEVDGTSLTSEITEIIKWNVSNDNGTLTIYPNGITATWLYCTNTNNGVKVGTGSAKHFTIKNGYLYEDGTSDARYIGVYNSQAWRCYTSINSNIENQTLKFYKYVPCAPTETTISFDANGGAGAPSSVTATKNKPMPSIASPLPSRTGYTFKGFYDAQSGGTKYYNADGTSAKEWDKDDAEYTLYALWTANQHSLTWDLNGGTVTTAGTNAAVNSTGTASGSVAYGTVIKAPVVIKTGYTFAGWHDGNAIVTPPNTMPDNNISYKAQWTPNPYTVQFDANEGTGTMSNQPFTYDVAQNLSENTYTRTGYNFTGWNTAADGTGTPYNDKAEVQNLTAAANGVVTLYAQWTAKKLINYRTLCTYNIEYTNLEGTTHTNPDTYTVADLPLTFTEAPSAREGYTFAGWNPASLDENTRGDQEVEAQWTVNQYTVTWKLNGGQWQGGGTDDRVNNHNYGEEVTRPVDPSRTGYTFTGWSPAEIPETMPAENLEFTAQWTPTPYTVTWKLGGIEYATSTVSIENPLSTAPENPSDGELGCCADKFMGWSSQQSPSAGDIFTEDNIPSNVTTAKIYYAVFATTAQGVGTSIADFSEMGYENGTAVTDPIVLGDGEGHGDATITLAKAQSSSNAPTYYTDGEAVRIYAGGTITIASSYHIKNVAFTFAAGDGSNEITANSGTYADGVWTENVESPTNNLIITIGGEAGQHRRIASITVTTGVSGSQYTNYVTQCTTLPNPALSGGSVPAIAVNCGDFSTLSNSQAIVFSTMQDLTCPVTFEVIEGDFLISTAKDRAAQYQSKITVTPTKSGDNTGKLKKVYVRANATDHNENFTGKIKVTSDEITDAVIINLTATVTCNKFTLTTVDHLGNETEYGTYFAGEVIATEPTPSSDACTANYTFDGWSTSEVKYGSVAYSKVTFPYTMPAEDVTLYPVYQCNKTADYHRVTSDLGVNNWAGDYLIAASSTIVADGRTSNLTQINNANIDENIVPASFGNLYYVSLIAVDGGYVLKTQDPAKPYIYITDAAKAGTPTNEITKADDYPLTIKWDTKSNIIIHNAKNTTGYTFQYSASASPARFGFFKAFPIYLYKKSPLYTSSLICEEITAEDAVVTSTKGQTVKVNVAATMSNMTIAQERTLTVESDNTDFTATISKTDTENQYNVSVSYTPSSEGDNTDGTETANITIKVNGNPVTTFQVTGRHLPATFAIVAKVGNVWYALPSQGLNSTTPPAAYPVEVDDMADPTAVVSVPANADWSLRQVYTSSGSDDRFAANGENLVFVNNASPAMTLNASSSEEENYLLADAQYNNYYRTNPGLYEWTPTTTDLETYQLTNEQRSRKLSVNTATVFGVHAQNKAVEQVRFLPITGRYTLAALQVVEWKENSVVIMYNGNPAQTASVSVNGGEVQETDLSSASAQRDIAVYELAANGLAANPTQRLSITIGTKKVILSIPYIISGAQTDLALLPGSTVAAHQEVAKVSDLVILKGATLTAAGAKGNPYKFRNVTIYGGGKLVIPSDKGFGVNSLTLRIGGVTADGNYDYVYPEFVLNTNTKDAYTNTSGKINLDYVTTKEQYYTFVAPFNVNTRDIKYPVDIYGNNVAANNTGSFEFQYYDGGARAAGEKGWKVVEEDPTDGATLTAHQGYTFYGMPRKVSVNGGTSTRQKFGIHRIPMTETAANVMSHENSEQPVAISAHPSEKNINSGWNLIGNPYMSTITGLDNQSIVTGTIVMVDNRWEWSNEDSQRFIVFPSNDGEWYYTSQASNATLPAFKNFFVQIDNEANALSIPYTHRASGASAPARRLAEDMDKDIELAIVLEQDDKYADQMDFLLNDAYSAVYDRNADFTKMMNNTNFNLFGVHMDDYLSFVAIDTHTARSSVAIGYQVPQAGQYTLRLSDKPYVMWSMVDAIYVTDHEVTPEVTTNLLDEAYTFQVSNAETNTTRFSISIVPSKESGGTTTAVDDILHQDMQTQKFIYNDQLYILRGGVVYDAMGQRVTTINQ